MKWIWMSAALVCGPLMGASGELKEAAKKLSAAHGESVVWLSVLSKTSMGAEGEVPAQLKAALAAQDKEEKAEVLGTVVGDGGLIVTALGGLDRSQMVNGQTVNTPMGEIRLKATSEVKEIKVILADGSEVPADLVLKDEDLGLAFVQVKKDSDEAQGVEFKPIDLKDSAKGDVLDDCIGLGRLDESLNREPSVITSEISGKVERPKLFYRVITDTVGAPVFLASGKLLGISVLRKPKNQAAGNGTISVMPVILPAEEVLKVAEQVTK